MPIYKGDTLINDVKLGGQNIANVYSGNVSVFSRNLLPYRVRVTGDGINNTYNSAGIVFDIGIDGYFAIDNASNSGNTWYGIILNSAAFNQMIGVTGGVSSCSILKTAWYDFISLMIGYDVTKTNFNNFTIASPFYALNASEWDSSGNPLDIENTHGWIFEEYGDYYELTYKVLDGTDFYNLQMIQSMSIMQEIQLKPFGQYLGGLFGVDQAWLVVSQSVTFIDIFGDMVIEYLTNNGEQVYSTLIQSLTNNFNFQIRSMILGCLSEVVRLNWNLSLSSDVKLLTINSYIPPQENVTGILDTQLVLLSSLLGE